MASGDIDLWGGVKTPFGKKTIDLNGQQAGAVSQAIVTEPGCTYRLKFYVGSYDNQSKNVYARAAGKKSVWPINVTGSTESPCLREFYCDFKARNTKTTIEIGSATQGPVVDNVACFKIADAQQTAGASSPQTEPSVSTPTETAVETARPVQPDEEDDTSDEEDDVTPAVVEPVKPAAEARASHTVQPAPFDLKKKSGHSGTHV